MRQMQQSFRQYPAQRRYRQNGKEMSEMQGSQFPDADRQGSLYAVPII